MVFSKRPTNKASVRRWEILPNIHVVINSEAPFCTKCCSCQCKWFNYLPRSKEKEYLALAEEASALLDKDTFRRVYQLATKEPYSFLYMKLDAKKLSDIFYIRFEKKITFPEEDSDDDVSPSEQDPPVYSHSSLRSTQGRAARRR